MSEANWSTDFGNGLMTSATAFPNGNVDFVQEQ